MGLPVHLEKREENSSSCVYSFGPPEEPVGQVILYKDSGDIELADLSSPSEGPSKQFYLSHAVSRLQAYHERDTYPASDRFDI